MPKIRCIKQTIQLAHTWGSLKFFHVNLWNPRVIILVDVKVPILSEREFELTVVDREGELISTVHWQRNSRTDRIHVERRFSTGVTAEIMQFSKGRLHDSPEGFAARQVYNTDSKASAFYHYTNGVLQDTVCGRPALTHYYSDSYEISLTQRYLAGELNDGPNGEPAEVAYEFSGRIKSQTHYRRGVEIPPPADADVASPGQASRPASRKHLGRSRGTGAAPR